MTRSLLLFLTPACVAAAWVSALHGEDVRGWYVGDTPDGWVSLFNGNDLAGWRVAAKPADQPKVFWTVREGSIACDTRGSKDHDYVWLVRQGEYSDFDLRLLVRGYRTSPGNSGIQIRSSYDLDAFWMDGPQIDVHPPAPWRTGLIYDETRGAQRWLFPSKKSWEIDSSAAPARWRWKYADEGDGWNRIGIIASGPHIRTSVNDIPIADLDGRGILNDEVHRRHGAGLLGNIALQLHAGDELSIHYKDIYIRPLPENRANTPSGPPPPSPYIDKGACPFECCVYRDWVALAPVTLYDRPNGERIVGRLRKGEEVQALTGEVHSVPLRVRAGHDFFGSGVKFGDTMYIIHYDGEGTWLAWHNGKPIEIEAYSDPGPYPEETWWVEVRTRTGAVGWTISKGNFGGQDGCA